MPPLDSIKLTARTAGKQHWSTSRETRSSHSNTNRATTTNSALSPPPSKRSSMRQAKKNAIDSMSSKAPATTQDQDSVTTPAKKPKQQVPSASKQGRTRKSPRPTSVNSTPAASKKSASKIVKAPSSVRKTPRAKKAPPGFTTPSPAVGKKKGSGSSKKAPNSPQWSRTSDIVLATVNTGKGNKKNKKKSAQDDPIPLPKTLKVVTSITLGNKSTFIVRLFAMMHYSHEHSPDICCWVDNGSSIEMWPKHPGLGDLLSMFFQHSKFLSFQRQLNNYGFIRTSEPISGRNSIAYYHAHLRFDSDPDTLETMVKYQGGKSPVKTGLGSPPPARNSIADPRRSPPKTPSKESSVEKKEPKQGSASKKALFSPSKKRSPSKKSPSGASHKRRDSRARTSPAKRAKIESPVEELEDEDAHTPLRIVVSNNTRYSKFHRMRSIGSASTFEETAAMVIQSDNYPLTKIASKKLMMNGQVGPSSVSPAGSNVYAGMAVPPPSFAFAVTGTPLVSNRKKDLMARPITGTPPEQKQLEGVPTPQSMSSPDHYAMLSSFLQTPSPQKRSKNGSTPGKDGFRLLFHAAEAVEHSPMLLASNAKAASLKSPAASAVPNSGAEASPITSMLTMDVSSFRDAMDALHQGP